MALEWERPMEHLLTASGYRVLRYRTDSGAKHYEAWPPTPKQYVVHKMLGIRDNALDAMALCEAHFQEAQR